MIKEVNEPCDCPFRVIKQFRVECNLDNDRHCCWKDRIPNNCPLLKEDVTVMFISIKKK